MAVVPENGIAALFISVANEKKESSGNAGHKNKEERYGPRCGRLGPSEAVREGDHVVE